jgi:integrase
MATFQERNGTWLARVSRKGYPKQFKTCPTKAQAQVWARSIEAAMDEGTFNAPASKNSEILFGDLLARYQLAITPTKRCRKSEHYRLGAMQRHRIASYSMANLTTTVLAEYRDERLTEVAKSSVCRDLATICSVITHAQREWGLKGINPVKLVKKPKLPPGRDRIAKPAELNRLMFELDAERHDLRCKWLVPLVQLALETAMRQGELLSLLWENVDLEERTAFLPLTKNGKARTVPLSSRAVEILSSLPRVEERVIPISQNVVLCAFPRATKRAGIKDFHFHDLRHMAATRLSKKLPNVIELGAVTGHSNVQNLKRYYHVTAQELALKIG